MSASKFVSLGGTPADRPEGNGVSDDTAAINLAFSSGNRCGPKPCQSSTTSPAIVYFPAGTYYISVPVIDFYYTQIIGNSRDLPTVKAISNFTAFARIDDDRYQSGNAVNPAGSLGFNSTILFSQATSSQNIIFRLSDAVGTQRQGLFIEARSGGFMSDLLFYGGLAGAYMGNQQFTSRNLSFYNSVRAINQFFDWGISSAFGFTAIDDAAQAGPISPSQSVWLEHDLRRLIVASCWSYSPEVFSFSNGSLILENVYFKNVRMAVQGPNNATALTGTFGSMEVAA
ncbi:MAG: hypothetical protein ASARMPREDX12_006539 [Alectoria sarmentosa]|nr:MAG: hypothetical protein ASARMPREDX12_006539 [Alectoria sarmentosa]